MRKRSISAEYELVLLCARLNINNLARQRIKELLCSAIGWDKIMAVSKHHDALPFLYYNLTKLNLQDAIPKEIFTIIKNLYYRNWQRNLLLEKEIILILGLADSGGIDIIPFQGFPLTYTLYHNHGLRIMVDVDFLVKKDGLQGLKDILAKIGYRTYIDEALVEYYYIYHNEIVFSKILSQKLTLLMEIHTALVPARPYKISLPRLWERAQVLTIGCQKMLCLSQEDTFLSLALHIRRHTHRLTLKFIVDIAELLKTYGDKFDWPYITRSARENHIITTIYFSIYIAGELLEASVSPGIMHEFRPNPLKRAIIYMAINKYNFFGLTRWRGIFLRLMFFDRLIDFLLYLPMMAKLIRKNYRHVLFPKK